MLIAPATDDGSMAESNITAIWLWMLTPAVLGAGTRVVTLRPMPTVLKLVLKGVSLLPSWSTAGAPIFTV